MCASTNNSSEPVVANMTVAGGSSMSDGINLAAGCSLHKWVSRILIVSLYHHGRTQHLLLQELSVVMQTPVVMQYVRAGPRPTVAVAIPACTV
mmetsp:Transcript_18837/g.28397  ORF Transcript_18837/g.28397 Transcript_18837/m.28397 type:complete len:93 (-) Transcript_18837:1896-2174(-)